MPTTENVSQIRSAVQNGDRIEITLADGQIVHVTIEQTTDGPRLELAGINVELEGDTPGSYYLL